MLMRRIMRRGWRGCGGGVSTPKIWGLEHEQSERPRKTRKLLGQETFAFFALFRVIRVPNVIALENS